MDTAVHAKRLRMLLGPLLEAMPAPALLFSAGIRSSLLAAMGAGRRAAAITVAVPGHAKDEPFVSRSAHLLSLTVAWVRPSVETLLDLLPQTVSYLKTDDPALLRAALVSHVGLLLAKELHLNTVLSGDAPTLAVGGESPFTATERLGNALGVTVHSPFRHPSIRQWLGEFSPQEQEAVLRRTLQDVGAQEPSERENCPADAGAGTVGLSQHFEKTITDDDFKMESGDILRHDAAIIRDKGHLYCYRLSRAQFGPPRNAVSR